MNASVTILRARDLALIAVATALLGGCIGGRRAPEPAPLVAAPSAPVRRAELPPPVVAPPPPVAPEPLPPEPAPTQVAAVDPAVVASPAAPVQVGRTDLLGGWTLASGGESCQLFMSLTTWTGGYRASTRGCRSPALAGISAWDLNGRTVTLKGGEGAATVASLSATEPQRFAGSTSGGAGITVSR